ncbi:MAG TPA: bifunctional enoyl-CoA hydratase/phosphate acetyltransferase [Azospirillaceae bacterium]|nr:bifunctional enoyl-CoA hydratase/phosphate acetyltransferase [Azospirillaceae bacterium]
MAQAVQRQQCPERLMALAAELGIVRVAVVAANSAVALESARLAAEAGLVDPVLVGDPAVIRRTADEIGWDLAGRQIVAAGDEAEAARLAVRLARTGAVAALMKGHLHTDVLMHAVLDRDKGLRTGRRLTHAFHMTVPGGGCDLIITDAAINVAPSVEAKLDIIRNAVDVAHRLGREEPSVAVLSCTEEVSERIPSTMEAAEVVRRCERGAVPGARVFGPVALDLAISVEAARIKGHRHPCAGTADILLVPSIETGNALFKMMVHYLDAIAAGVVLGASVPIVLTSRADPPAARVAAAAIANIMAQPPPSGRPHTPTRQGRETNLA